MRYAWSIEPDCVNNSAKSAEVQKPGWGKKVEQDLNAELVPNVMAQYTTQYLLGITCERQTEA